jgi:hypothetical protein
LTAAAEISSAVAVSSIVMPPKNRHSTMWTCRGLCAASRSSVEIEDAIGFPCRQVIHFFERDMRDTSSALDSFSVTGVVDENLAAGDHP